MNAETSDWMKKEIMEIAREYIDEEGACDKDELDEMIYKAYQTVRENMEEEYEKKMLEDITDELMDEYDIGDDDEETGNQPGPKMPMNGMIFLGGNNIEDFKKGLKAMEQMLGVKLYD